MANASFPKKSIEEKVEDYFKKQLDTFGIKYFTKTESINPSIDNALKTYGSKSGGTGNNYPDIKVLIKTENQRFIPVMIEAKGKQGDMVGYEKNSTEINMTPKAVQKYAVNGALHYVNALIESGACWEAIAIGVNGWVKEDSDLYTEIEVYYVSQKKHLVPLKIQKYTDLSFLKESNLNELVKILDELNLSEAEIETLTIRKETELEEKVHAIHQAIYDDNSTNLGTDQKLYLFCGLIMAGLSIPNLADLELNDLKGNALNDNNDGKVIISRIEQFFNSRNTEKSKQELILNLLKNVFNKETLWYPKNGESFIKQIFKKIKDNIVPLLNSNLHLDFTGKIFNKLSDWIHIDNDNKNDVVLTPRYITRFMAKLARTDKDSYVLDSAMGSAGFLVSAMDLMIRDANSKITDRDKLEEKIKRIKEEQILGIEKLDSIYVLAILNMFLMGDGTTHLINKDSLTIAPDFPATVFLLNPPYSETDKGLNFVNRALSHMLTGYGCVLIQENAGAGQGVRNAAEILKKNTLVASIHMPVDIFRGKSSVQTAIYLFKVNQPHDKESLVTFIDMSEDGYSRQGRKKSPQAVNLKDTNHAKERYQEVLDIVLNRKLKTAFYTEANGKVIRDTISLKGNDWTFAQHKKIDLQPTIADFKKTVSDFLAWKVSSLIKEQSEKEQSNFQ